jgi:hypothetical protein
MIKTKRKKNKKRCKKLLELKELSQEREALKQEKAQELEEEGLFVDGVNNLLKQKRSLKRKNRKLQDFIKRAELNPRYVEEYQQILRQNEVQRDYYRLM